MYKLGAAAVIEVAEAAATVVEVAAAVIEVNLKPGLKSILPMWGLRV